MKQYFFTIFLVTITLFSWCQNPPIDFDKNYKFLHFNGMLITKEDSIKGSFVIDTIYSCDYDSLDRKIAIRKYHYSNNADGTTFNNYDKNGQLLSQIFYEQTQRGKEIGCSRISLTINSFNSFDSVSLSENHNCNRILKSDIAEKEKVNMQNIKTVDDLIKDYSKKSINDFTSDWDCSKTFITKKSYYPNKLLESSTMYAGNEIGFRIKYNYDNLGRLIHSSFNQFEVGLSEYSWISYNDTIRVQVDTSTIWNQPVIKKITTSLNKNNQPVQEIEEWTQFDNIEYSSIHDKGIITRYYEYDKNKKLIVVKEFYKEGFYPTIYRYYYKNKNGG